MIHAHHTLICSSPLSLTFEFLLQVEAAHGDVRRCLNICVYVCCFPTRFEFVWPVSTLLFSPFPSFDIACDRQCLTELEAQLRAQIAAHQSASRASSAPPNSASASSAANQLKRKRSEPEQDAEQDEKEQDAANSPASKRLRTSTSTSTSVSTASGSASSELTFTRATLPRVDLALMAPKLAATIGSDKVPIIQVTFFSFVLICDAVLHSSLWVCCDRGLQGLPAQHQFLLCIIAGVFMQCEAARTAKPTTFDLHQNVYNIADDAKRQKAIQSRAKATADTTSPLKRRPGASRRRTDVTVKKVCVHCLCVTVNACAHAVCALSPSVFS
jgi:hypothetical protein